MVAALEVPTKLLVVVELAVEDHPDRLGFIGDGLLAGLHVDDRQSTHPQPYAIVEINPYAIRTPMRQEGAHPSHEILVDSPDFLMRDSRNATHGLLTLLVTDWRGPGCPNPSFAAIAEKPEDLHRHAPRQKSRNESNS